ncbi:MAG TPA: hypothetical protein PKY26_07580 [Acetivibrio clariflavus]|nr:hypothetical protein [Acetivibrio clariflavus]
MKGFGYFINPVKRRPVLIVILGIFMFLYCYIEYSFIMPIVFGLSVLKTGNIFDSVIHLIQIVLNYIPNINPAIFVYILLGIVAASLIAGLLLSGSLNVLNSALVNSDKEKGAFAKGIQKHYLKVSRITFLSIIYLILFTIFIVVVSVPAIVITSAAITEKPELMSVAYVLDFITVLILFFCIMFFKIYIFFWYPAAINYDKQLFARGKRAADNSFWRILLKFLWYDILIFVFQMGLFYINNILSRNESVVAEFTGIVVLLFLNWIFKTVILISIISYVFSKFLSYWNRSRTVEN